MQLEIRDLFKSYANGAQALKDVCLTIPTGTFGLLGPRGAGKSTLLRILAAQLDADRGTARLGDLDVLGQKDEVRRTLGYLPQEPGAYPNVGAEALLDHFALLRGVVRHWERRETVEALLRQAGLWELRKQKLGSCPGGVRRRFALAAALLGNPKLLLLDEPTSGLDAAERAHFLDLLGELGENRVLVLATRRVEDVRVSCTRMAFIVEGEVAHSDRDPGTCGTFIAASMR